MSGGKSEEVTPVPIPNTEVKLFSADGSWVSPARVGRCQTYRRISSAGRAPALQAGGRRFKSCILHHLCRSSSTGIATVLSSVGWGFKSAGRHHFSNKLAYNFVVLIYYNALTAF